MRASQFYEFGRNLGESVRGLMPQNASFAPESSQRPEQRPQSPQSPQPLPQGELEGEPNMSGGRFNYDYRVTDQIVKQYMDAGYDPRFAIGMAANAVVESSLSPTAYNKPEGSYGLFQWRQGRLDGLRDFVERSGGTVDDINSQISFSLEELETTEAANAQKIFATEPQTAAQYARMIDKFYERSDGKARDTRAAIAASMYQDYFGQGGRFSGRGEPSVGPSPETLAYGAGTEVFFRPETAKSQFIPSNEEMGREAFIPPRQEQTAVDPYIPPPPSERTSTQDGPFIPPRQSQTEGLLPQTGTQREGLKGLRDVFMRREGEGDEEFRDRRRAMFLSAAEGFQMLSRGVKADFNTPVEQRLNERQNRFARKFNVSEAERDQANQDRNYALQVAQEERLNRALQLDEKKFVMEQLASEAEKEENRQEREALAGFYDEQGMEDLAELTRLGQATAATNMFEERAKDTQDMPFITPQTRNSMADAMENMGNQALADVLRNETNNDAVESAYKEAVKASVDATPEGEVNETVRQNLIDMAGDDLTEGQRARVVASAENAARDSDVLDEHYDLVQNVREEKSAVNDTLDAARKSYNEKFERELGPSRELADAGRQNMSIASNPEFDSGKLRGSILNPIARYIRDIPGLESVGEDLLGVDDTDLFGDRILDAVRSGQLGNLAQGVTGQLSNLEGQMLLRQLGSGEMGRVEIMALGQMMYKRREQLVAMADAKLEYERLVREGEVTPSIRGMEDYIDSAARNVETFVNLDSDAGRAQYAQRRLKEYADKNDMPLQEVMQMDINNLPPDIAGEVVTVPDGQGGHRFVPLFAERYGDEYK